MNINGPKIEPWCTPVNVFSEVDFIFFSCANCSLFCRSFLKCSQLSKYAGQCGPQNAQ